MLATQREHNAAASEIDRATTATDMRIGHYILGPLVVAAVTGCSAESSDEPGDASTADMGASAGPDVASAEDGSTNTSSDATQADAADSGGQVGDVSEVPMGGPCLGRDPLCDAPIGPLATTLRRGVTGFGVYESDWYRCPYGADCYSISVELLLVETEGDVDAPEAARAVVDEYPTAWQQFEEGFEIPSGEGPHLLCVREVDWRTAYCAAIHFDTDTVLSAVLWSGFGPGQLYVVRNADGAHLPTFELPPA